MGNDSLSGLFKRAFDGFGFDFQEGDGIITFESNALRGSVILKKPFTVSWKAKRGFVIADHPIANGNSSAQFNKVGDCLNFLRKYILHK